MKLSKNLLFAAKAEKCSLLRKILILAVVFFSANLTIIRAQQQEQPIRFAVVGDFGSGEQEESNVANLIKSWNPDFVVTVGDNNYPDGEASTIDRNIGKDYHSFIYPYTGSYGAGATVNRFFPILGNHDWETPGAQPYLNYFTLPGNERYYDFVRGPIHFFAIDSDEREPDGITETSVQGNWLKNKLMASTAKWKIVLVHHTPYCSRTSTKKLQWKYQEWGATAVIAGHAHLYERVIKNGFPYITNGLGGESKGTFGTPIEGSMVRFGNDYGAMLVSVTSDTITFQFITRANVLIDTFTITTVVPQAASNLTATATSSSRVNLSWTDNANNEEGYKIERCQNAACTNFAEVAQVGRNVTAYNDTGRAANTAYRYRVRGFNDVGAAAYSNIANTTTQSLPPIPFAPSNLTAMVVSNRQVNLSWTDNSNNESGFKIERCQGAGCSNFTETAQLAADTTVFNDSSLLADTTYVYRARAFNEGGNSNFSNTIQTTTAPSVSSVLSDDFGDSVRDTAKWSLGLLSRGSSNFDSQIPVLEQNGRLSIALRASQSGNHYSGYVSAGTWNLSDSIAAVEVPQKASGNAVTIFSVGIDKDDWYGFRTKNNSLLLEYRKNGSTTATTLTYNAVQHRYWRFRHDAVVDAVIFETSADAINWTARRTVERQIAITAIKIELIAGTGEAVSAPGTALFDNFMLEMNTAPPAPPQSPGNLIAESVSNGQINLAWTDNSDDEDSFKIERCEGAGCIDFVQISQVGMNATSYTDTELAGETIFRYRARAFNNGADSPYSNIVEATTPTVPELPEAPSNLIATTISNSQINLTWSVNSATEEGFDIERCAGIGCNDFVEISEVGVDISGFSDTGLHSGTTYNYRIRAFNGGGYSDYSEIVGSTTTNTPTAPPEAPSNLTATAVSTFQINLTWADFSATETNFKIERCQDFNCTNFIEIVQTEADITSFVDTGRTAGTMYRYRIRAFNSAGNSDYSNTSEATTQSLPPDAPSNLTATAQSATQINLTWTDNSFNEDGFQIERCQNTGCSNFVAIARVNLNVIGYEDTGRAGNTTYVYRVRAFTGGNISPDSNIANATTPEPPPASPAAPTNLTATYIPTNTINLSWTDNSNNESEFKIERCQNTGCANFIEFAQVGANGASFSDATVVADTIYRYRIRAFNGGGDSAYSNIAEANTNNQNGFFSDDFNDGVRDAAKWNVGIFSYPVTNFDSQILVLEQTGRLSIGPRASLTGTHYNGYVSVSTSNLTNASAGVQVLQKAGSNAQTVFSIGSDNNNYYRFRARGNTLYLERAVGGIVSTTSIASTSDPRYWRFRHDAATDSIIFETSADEGATWVLRRTVPRQIAITAVKIELVAGTSESVVTPGTALFDNFRLTMNGTP